MASVDCPKCQRPVMQNASFCTYCGFQIPLDAVQPAQTCRKCRGAIKSEDRFCTSCGVTLPDRCECGVVLSPTAAFCTKCGAARPEGAKPQFDMTEFADFEDNITCKSCGYHGRMPVIGRSQSNINPMAGSVVISESFARNLRYQMISGLIDTVTTTNHVRGICPNCRKTLHWKG